MQRLLWGCGPLVLSAAAFVCSLIALQVKLLSQPIPASHVTLFSSAISLAVTSTVLLFSSRACWPSAGTSSRDTSSSAGTPTAASFLELPSSRRELLLVLARGLLGALAVTSFYAAVELLPLHTAVTLFFTSPVFAVLLEALVRRSSISASVLLGCTLAVVGVVLLGTKGPCFLDMLPWQGPGSHGHLLVAPNSLQAHSPSASTASSVTASAGASAASSTSGSDASEWSVAGVVLGVVAALANAAAFVTVAELGAAVSPLTLTWYYHAIVVVVSLSCCVLGAPTSASNWMAQRHDVWLLLGISAANLVGQLLLNRGFQLESASRGSAINTSQVLYSYVWEILLLHGKVTACALVGSAAIVVGLICVGSTVATSGKPGPADQAQGWHPEQQQKHQPHQQPQDLGRAGSDVEANSEQLEAPLLSNSPSPRQLTE